MEKQHSTIMNSELHVINSFDEWNLFLESYPKEYDSSTFNEKVENILANGFVCPFHKEHVSPDCILNNTSNFREGLVYKGLNSRLRAVYLLFEALLNTRPRSNISIFAAEAITEFALLMRGRFCRFLGTEYFQDAEKEKYFPIPHCDITNMPFPSSSFDFLILNDVFEHVYSIEKALSEIFKITKPGGHLISTFPFNMGQNESIKKAQFVNDKIEYLVPPEYHGNPLSEDGSLVFEIPGWNILEMAKKAGFTVAQMHYIHSQQHGILGADFSGVFVFVAQKNQ